MKALKGAILQLDRTTLVKLDIDAIADSVFEQFKGYDIPMRGIVVAVIEELVKR